jgi:hypothetical protein
MDENDLKAQYVDVAGELLALAEKLDRLKSVYNWMRASGGQLPTAPPWDGGVQVLETLRTTIQVDNVAVLYDLAYATE